MITVEPGRAKDPAHVKSIWIHRPDHLPQLIGVLVKRVGTGDERAGWTIELTPQLQDRLTDQQKLHLKHVTGRFPNRTEGERGAAVVVGMLLSWWMANQLPRNTFDDLETAVR
ncbi:hypothetical protein PBI_HILLTOPFARM_109 [Mycobacterium phage Hilltopfarm]|nr:hypothetical protein PBI_HILLTOPFARM_109 [Mycobacterium phage Hilltopfarm]